MNKIIKKISYIKKIAYNFSRVDRIIDERLAIARLNNSVDTVHDSLISDNCLLNKPLIVSLTTYNKRIHDVNIVIESIGRQTVKPNQLILWLDINEFPNYDSIPLKLQKMMSRGLDVRFCENLRSYKKLVPTLEQFPDSHIITIDDDIIYPDDMLELLIRDHKNHPDCLIGMRAHRVTYDKKGNIKKYKHWKKNIIDSEASDEIFLTTGAGTFFPYGVLSKELLNKKLFMEICPSADDIWVKVISMHSNVKCKRINDTRCFDSRFIIMGSSQDIGLFNTENKIQNNNDIQLLKSARFFNIKLCKS
ncbi:hypothetical protein A9263_15190 [Vibrio cyclitrophicus]|nr:hypothetical protein A9263_15190 [Vibrio cyclitrophicus]